MPRTEKYIVTLKVEQKTGVVFYEEWRQKPVKVEAWEGVDPKMFLPGQLKRRVTRDRLSNEVLTEVFVHDDVLRSTRQYGPQLKRRKRPRSPAGQKSSHDRLSPS